MIIDTDQLVTKKEAAKILKCSVTTLNRLLAKKKISYYKPSGKVLLNKGDLVKFIEDHKNRCA